MRLFLMPLLFQLQGPVDLYDPRIDHLYRWYLGATVIGVVGAFIGIMILIYQAVLTRRSAEAARLSAEALMDSERAWILVDVTGENGRPSLIFGESLSFDVKTWNVTIHLICKNEGRTPAWILERRIGILPVTPVPDKPPLGEAKVIETEPVTLLAGGPSFDTCETVESDKPIGLENGRVIYGAVKYRDIYGRVRETTFGYRVSAFYTLRRMQDFPAYNQHS